MTRNLIYIFTLMLMLVGISGCKSSKSVTGSDISSSQTSSVLQEVAASYRNWDSFSSSGKITLSGAASISSSMQIKMVHNKYITVSIRPILGIEAAKVYIDNDSAVVVNKLNKTYTSLPLSQFSHILPVDITTVQDIILARIFSVKDGALSVDNLKKFDISAELDDFIVTSRKKQNDFSYAFSLNNAKQLTSLTVSPSASSKKYTANYSGYDDGAIGTPASNIKLSTAIKGKDITFEMYLNPSKNKWDNNSDESFSIGKNYRKVTINEFITSLKSL